MKNFVVINDKKKMKEPGKFLLKNKYYKSYTLFLANEKKINILDTLVLTSENSIDVLENYIADDFDIPIMLRMDYDNLSNAKYIGGIPLFTLEALKESCFFLFKNGYIPVLQPYVERFENTCNLNCSISNNTNDLFIELTGKGFDAGDLRLGLVEPHEKIMYDYLNWEILSRDIISHDNYLITKKYREMYITKLESYIKYVNNKFRLLENISDLKENYNIILNEKYVPISKETIEETAFLAYQIKNSIIPLLPYSHDYILSFSILKEQYVLWDIYGKWYYR